MRRRSSPRPIGGSEVVSTPPAAATSYRPAAMPSAAAIAACRPVPQACCRSNAGVYGESSEPSTHSRIRLKSRLCLSTAPPTTMSSRSPASPNRSTKPLSAAVNMSWLDASA
ncbi:Uncharacterised protein [Mycobacterium tuberculosis]|nr:Uncharacterised protein [Mycobacterium tuberculosis]